MNKIVFPCQTLSEISVNVNEKKTEIVDVHEKLTACVIFTWVFFRFPKKLGIITFYAMTLYL